MSTLKVNNLDTQTGSNIVVASGKSFIAPNHVVQVTQNTISGTNTSTSQTSFQTSPITHSITPLLSSSKILFKASFSLFAPSSHSTYATLYRGSTELSGNANGIIRIYSSSGADWHQCNLEWLDTPNTTSSTTYTVYFKVSGGTGYINETTSIGVVTLMEIAQ